MICKINKLKAHNFMSFKDFEIDFSRYSGFTFISGRNEYQLDNAGSNGVGKSSIEEAIIWSLTGNTLRGTKEVKRFNSEDTCFVEINFSIDNDNYIIIRSKDKTNLQLFVNSEDISGKGIRDTEKILQERLPDITASLIGSVIILGQGLPQRLTNNTPSGRKEVLEQLSKSDFMIEDLKRRITSRKNYLLAENRKLEDDILQLNTTLDIKHNLFKEVENKLENLKSSEDLQKEIKSLELNRADLQSIVNDNISKANEAQENITKYVNLFNEASNKFLGDDLQIKTKYINLREEKRMRFIKVRGDAEKLKKDIQTKKAITDICPTCGQKIIGVIKPDTSQEESRLIELEKEVASLDEYLNDIQKSQDEEHSRIKENHNTLIQSYRNEESKCRSDLNIFTSIYTKAQNDIKDIDNTLNNLKTELNVLESKRIDLNNQLNSLTIELQTLESNLLYNNNDKDNLKKHIEAITKMETSIKRDFRGYLLSNIITYINNKCKEYSLDVFNNRNIEFKLDGNNISISYNNKEYENLSGGEKQKIDLIVQLAIRSMLCTYLNFSCNILMLDEITDNLDSIGCQNIINFITTKLVDIESIFIISHHQDIQLPYDNEILIRKNEDGVSEIV